MRPRNADTAKDRILRALQYGDKDALQLAHPSVGGLRYTARIAELREEGWDIRTLSIEGQSYCLYRLTGRKAQVGQQIKLW
jgi:hypothetical protein